MGGAVEEKLETANAKIEILDKELFELKMRVYELERLLDFLKK